MGGSTIRFAPHVGEVGTANEASGDREAEERRIRRSLCAWRLGRVAGCSRSVDTEQSGRLLRGGA
jgi:hypothetical protein